MALSTKCVDGEVYLLKSG
jgi:hypothetical protein